MISGCRDGAKNQHVTEPGVTAKQPQQTEEAGRIIFFPGRPISRKGKARHRGAQDDRGEELAEIGDLSEYERRNSVDDYPRRMILNAAAFAFILMLTVAGVWLADAMALLRKHQDCAFSGRLNCAEINVPARDR